MGIVFQRIGYRNHKMKSVILLSAAFLASFAFVECQWGGGSGLGLLALKGLLLKGAAIGYAIGSSSNRRHSGGRGRGYRRNKGYNHGHSHGHSNGYSSGYSSGGYSSGCGGFSYGCGGYSRWRREIKGDVGELRWPKDDLIIQAEFQDFDDCAKMFVCQLNAKPEDSLNDVEKIINDLFGTNENGALDFSKPSALFDFAATVGRDAGLEQCKTLYARCQMPYQEMMKFMNQKEVPFKENDL